jgi:hypothetical protein
MGEATMTGLSPGRGFQFCGHHQRTFDNGSLELRVETIEQTTKAKITLFYTIFTTALSSGYIGDPAHSEPDKGSSFSIRGAPPKPFTILTRDGVGPST